MKTGLLSAAHRPGHATLGANALLALAYTATGLAGLRFEFFHVAVTTVWPPSGIALAALLLFGLRLAPGVAIGAFAVSLSSSGSLIGALGVGVVNTLAAAAGALALTRFFRFNVQLARLRDMVALLLIGVAVCPLIAATLSPLMLLAAGALSQSLNQPPPTPLAGKRVSFQRVNSRIARSRPCSVSGYMRSPIRLRIMPMDS